MADIKKVTNGMTGAESAQTLFDNDVNLNTEIFQLKTELTERYGNYIDSDEYVKVITDNEDRVLVAFRLDGSPYFPKNEMYSITSNDEFIAAWIDTANKVIFGIRQDGGIYAPGLNISEDILAIVKENLAQLKTELTERYGDYANNEEYVKVITDKDGKILFAIRLDGTPYFANREMYEILSNDEFLKIVTDANQNLLFAIRQDGTPYFPKNEMFGKQDDVENRLHIVSDSENRIIEYITNEGVKVVNVLKVGKEIQFTDESTQSLINFLKDKNIGRSVGDWSDKSSIALPFPRACVRVDITINGNMPTEKGQDLKCFVEYTDIDGNYFQKQGIINAQGSSSLAYVKKNFSIDLLNDDGKSFDVKFGNWNAFDSYHWKAFYIDNFRGQAIASYRLAEDVIQSRPLGSRRPWEYLYKANAYNGVGVLTQDIGDGSLTHPDAFSFVMYVNGSFHGVYAWCIKKSRGNYQMKKTNAKQIILDGNLDKGNIWGGSVNWNQFEIRNPSGLKDTEGNKYDGDNPKELSDTDALSSEVKGYIKRLSGAMADIQANKTKATFEKYFLPTFFIDYLIHSQVVLNYDGFAKNWIWCTWDGKLWTPTFYDHDTLFGMHWNGNLVLRAGLNENTILGTTSDTPAGLCSSIYADDIKARYKELRDNGILTIEHIINRLKEWTDSVGYDNYKLEFDKWIEPPSYRDSLINAQYWEQWSYYQYVTPSKGNYDNTASYVVGDTVQVENGLIVKCIANCQGQKPYLDKHYDFPNYGGFYNSIERVREWLKLRFQVLDNYYNY